MKITVPGLASTWPLKAMAIGLLVPSAAGALDVRITPLLDSVPVVHDGRPFTIQRNQDPKNLVKPYFAYTSRNCPPFCIQPIQAAPGVQTVGELEVLDYLRRIGEGDQTLLVVDARTPQWPARGMIPGAINVPWTQLVETESPGLGDGGVLERVFGARREDNQWNFGEAKTLILYCNGMWCSQSTNSVTRLLEMGYPAEKLKWYRGGMQNWENLGLATVKADGQPAP